MYFRHPKYTLQNKQPLDILTLIKNIDQFYAALKLYWHLILHNNRSYLSEIELKKEEEILLNAIREVCLKGYFDEAPQVKFLAELLNAFNLNDFSNYIKLKEDFIKHFDSYNEKEKNVIIILLFSVCYHNHKSGKDEALMQLFELNCFMLENNLIIYDGYIQFDQFWSIVTIGFAAKQNLWTEDFIKKFGTYLPDNEKDDVLAVCNAMVGFHKKNYADVLRILSTIKFQNTLYGLYARNIQLKCYYELDNEYEEMFWGFTNSFKMFLYRNKNISDTMKEDFKNYIAFSKDLYKMKNKTQLCDPVYMKKKLEQSANMASKTWLLEKINEISSIKNPKANI